MRVAGLRLRPASGQDLHRIERLEELSFGNPWPFDAYAQELERDVAVVDVAEVYGVDGIVGVSCSWLVDKEAHLMRIASDPVFRRRGIGQALLAAALERARMHGCETMTLEVASLNGPALTLYRRAGFEVIGVRKGYYTSPPDDALVMQCRLRPMRDP